MGSRHDLCALLATVVSIASAVAVHARPASEQNSPTLEDKQPDNLASTEASLKAALADAENTHLELVPGALTNLARLYRQIGRDAEAEMLYKRVVDLTRQISADDRRAYASSLNNLAVFYHDRGQYNAAEPLYRQTLQVREGATSPNASDIAAALLNLARLYQDTHDDKSAANALLRVKMLWESHHAIGDRQAAGSLFALGEIRQRSVQPEEANSLYGQALQIWENDLPMDASTPAMLLHLAEVYGNAGDYLHAERCYRAILNHRREVAVVPQAITAATELGQAYILSADYVEAEQAYRTALQLKESSVGPDSLELASPISNVALVLNSLGHYSEALPFYLRAATIREKHLGTTNPEVVQSFLLYASCLRNSGNSYEALVVESRFRKPERVVQRVF
jgi:tetratricopeptide (TPR) repeat protein